MKRTAVFLFLAMVGLSLTNCATKPNKSHTDIPPKLINPEPLFCWDGTMVFVLEQCDTEPSSYESKGVCWDGRSADKPEECPPIPII